MGSVVFGCIHIGNSNDLSKTFFDTLDVSDLVVVENQYRWDAFCLENNINYTKKVLSINLSGLKGKFLNELPNEIQGMFHENRLAILDEVLAFYKDNKNILVLSDEGSAIVADSGEIVRNYCLENDIPFKVMSGPSAVINSVSMSNIIGPTSPFIFYGPMFSLEYLDDFLGKINNAPYNFLGVAFLNQRTAKDVVGSVIDMFGDLDGSLCVNLTMNTEKVIGKTLSDVFNYLTVMGNDYHLTREKISLVFRKSDNR